MAALSITNLQFGKYRGKNFLWLLENDVGYATMLMADHGKIRETINRVGDPQWENKEALYRYCFENSSSKLYFMRDLDYIYIVLFLKLCSTFPRNEGCNKN